MSSGYKIQLRLLICVCLLILWMLATVDQFISFNISFKSPKFWSQNSDKFSDYDKFLAWTRKQSHLRQHMKQTCSKLGWYTNFWSLNNLMKAGRPSISNIDVKNFIFVPTSNILLCRNAKVLWWNSRYIGRTVQKLMLGWHYNISDPPPSHNRSGQWHQEWHPEIQ